MDPLFLPVPDACRALGISRSTLYELIADGQITPAKLGRKTLIPRGCLLDFAARLASTKPEAA